jgi:hypothetical protein
VTMPAKASDSPVPGLKDALDGQVIGPDHSGYDIARSVFYTGFDRRCDRSRSTSMGALSGLAAG